MVCPAQTLKVAVTAADEMPGNPSSRPRSPNLEAWHCPAGSVPWPSPAGGHSTDSKLQRSWGMLKILFGTLISGSYLWCNPISDPDRLSTSKMICSFSLPATALNRIRVHPCLFRLKSKEPTQARFLFLCTFQSCRAICSARLLAGMGNLKE